MRIPLVFLVNFLQKFIVILNFNSKFAIAHTAAGIHTGQRGADTNPTDGACLIPGTDLCAG